jgi:MoaA/NifB/PqqE/SkfB family radical SAM enzyme
MKKSEVEEVEMDLVGLCNLQCPLCTRNYSHANHMLYKNVRSIDEIKTQLDQYTNLQRFFIAGAVSEPTMYKDFVKFLEYLNSRDIYYELFTNGNTHKPDWWQMIGELVPQKCMTVFTICGSTQELHEKYRVGSSLQQILDHADAYRKNGKKNDWIQHIRFEYNDEDLKSKGMQDIINQFSNKMLIDSEGIRRLTNYNRAFQADVRPVELRDKAIKKIFFMRPRPDDGKNYEIRCRSFLEKKVYINQRGQVSACYTHAENEADYFENEEYDYSDILSFKYPDCFLCEKKTRTLIDKTGLKFVC